MNKKKLGMMLAAMGLVGVVAIGGTLALLSDQSGTVTNTFAIGDFGGPNGEVAIVLHEEDNTSDGDSAGDKAGKNEDRTTDGNEYTAIVPGTELVKDPTVSIYNTDIAHKIYVKVTNVDELVALGAEIAIDTQNWERVGNAVEADAETLDGIYVYKTTSPMNANGKWGVENYSDTTPIFDGVTFPSTLTSTQIEAIKTATDKDIVVKAAIVQVADDVDTAQNEAITMLRK